MSANPILPGRRLGIVGGGQLGRMIAFAAQRMGYSVAVLDPDPNAPAMQVARFRVNGEYSDHCALAELAACSDVITYEFENISVAAVKRLEKSGALVHPSSEALLLKMDRALEKRALQGMGLPIAAFMEIVEESDLTRATSFRYPAVMKVSRGGYDGKGQAVVRDPREAVIAFASFGSVPCVLEEKIDFKRELSIVGARGADGTMAFYPCAENLHAEGILHRTTAPAPDLAAGLQENAVRIASTYAKATDYVGVFCVELFETDNALLVNEVAPRPHNSGHYTIEAAETSQFEQHVRAVCGLPLGSIKLVRPATMWNIIGGVNHGLLESLKPLLSTPGAYLHLYGKDGIRPGRKLGHFTLLGRLAENAQSEAIHANGRQL